MRKTLIVFILLIGVLSSCADKHSEPLTVASPRVVKQKVSQKEEKKDNTGKSSEFENVKKKNLQQKHRIALVKIPSFTEEETVSIKSVFGEKSNNENDLTLPSGNVQLSIEEMPVYDFLNLVFGKILNLNYTISTDIQRTRRNVTINMSSPMKAKDFLAFVLKLLKDYQIQVEYDNGVFKISKLRTSSSSRSFSLKVFIGREIPQTLRENEKITLVIPTYYISGTRFTAVVKQFIKNDKEITIKPFPFSSQLSIVSGKASSVKEILNLLKIFDRPYFTNKQFYLLTLEYLSVEEFYKELEKVLKPMGIPISEKPSDNKLSLIPLKRKNALFIISPIKNWIDTVIYWKKQLDSIDALGSEPQLFIYKPHNRSAEELLNVLNSILPSIKGATKKTKEKEGKSRKTNSTFSSNGFKATVDKERNTLIILAYPSDFKKVKRILEKLDTQPKQVLIEVTIAEVTLTDQLQYGLEWYIKHSGEKVVGELQTLGGLGIGGAGFNYSLKAISRKFNILLNSFTKKNLINIISTPHIVVLDGKDATINVGTEVPVVSSETTATDIGDTVGTPSILRNVQYRSTGIILRVKPIVTSNNMLTIEINQELSEAQANNVSNIDSPLILNRSINTSLVLKSGDTVLLGGLISENKSKTKSEVPILGDIPILGNLFRVESKGNNKTELIVMITPKIIASTDELKEVTKFLSENFEKEGEKLKKERWNYLQ